MILTSCSKNDNSNKNQNEVPKPLPQVRIVVMPTATDSIPLPTEISTPTPAPENTATPMVIYYDPTPDVEFLANQIEGMMDEIERKLRSENFILKP